MAAPSGYGIVARIGGAGDFLYVGLLPSLLGAVFFYARFSEDAPEREFVAVFFSSRAASSS
jgi:hypothetical protein